MCFPDSLTKKMPGKSNHIKGKSCMSVSLSVCMYVYTRVSGCYAPKILALARKTKKFIFKDCPEPKAFGCKLLYCYTSPWTWFDHTL